jgi:transcriptional regulator with XRE-family HTH domain
MDYRRFFGKQVRRLRTEDGQTQEWIGQRARYSDRAVGMVESGERPPSEHLAAYYDELYGMRGVLVELGNEARRDTSGFDDWVAREQAADYIRTYETGLIPGLLQTPDYARAVIKMLTPYADIDEAVRTRIGRQGVLKRARVRALVEEAALERAFDIETQAEQLAHLLAQPEDVAVQVVPTAAGMHPGVVGPMTILHYDDGGSPIIRTDGRRRAEFIDHPREVARIEEEYDAILSAALPVGDSAEFIEAVMKELYL